MYPRLIRRLLLAVFGISGSLATAADRPVPYWASITAGDALMRTGPGQAYPAIWRYRRAGLPIKVIQVHESWRRIRDVDGTEGWMASVLLTADRTAMVVGAVRPMRSAPDELSRLLWRAEPGVVGRIRHCGRGWCEFDVRGKTGYVETSGLWGVDPSEVID
jgi:SH3-like domain-containing protein